MKTKTLRAIICAFGCAVVLGSVAGYQLVGVSRDYDNYMAFFLRVSGSSLADALSYRFEPGFTFFSHQMSSFDMPGPLVYALIAGLCMLIKFLAIARLKNYWAVFIVLLVFYIGRYFTVFEMTILRTAVALSLAFFVFLRRDSDVIKLSDILILTIAVSMHYSAVIMFPIYLYTPKNRSAILSISVIVFVVVFLLKDIVLAILPQFFVVFLTYEDLTGASIIPKPMILDIIFLCFMLYHWRYNDFQMKVAVYAICVSFALHFALLDYSIFASRLRDLLAVFFLVYVVRSLQQGANIVRLGAIIFSLLSSSLYLYAAYIYDPLLT